MRTSLKILLPILIVVAIIIGVAHNKMLSVFKGHTTILKVNHLPANGDKSLTDYYNQSEQLSKQQTASTTVTFLAAGDIMLSRNVASAIKKARDADLPFHNMSDILKSTDFNFANLENPIASSTAVVGGHSLIFGAPLENIKGLADYNFKIVNLANNHAFDQGLPGLNYTRQVLDQNNIQHVGTGDNLDQAWQPAVVTQNGIKICFVGSSYSSINDGGKATNSYVARMGDLSHLKLEIENSKLSCDFIVATMHAGVEYTRTPNQAQKDFAHIAIDDGADMVIGAHPHWVQTIEKYNGKYIFYSLGNFVFDQMFSQDTREGLTLKITVSEKQIANKTAPGAASLSDLQGSRVPATLDSIELIPIIIDNYSTPRPATPDETKKILTKIGETETTLYP